jgi:FixJ family two-component response regulator
MTNAKIAIVDDDAGFRTALRELLRVMGYDTLTFGSAEEFLSSSRHGIDCLIADVHLPRMSGVVLVKTLASTEAELPAILITSHDDPATFEMIRSAGPVPHLRKPFSDEQLIDALARVLPD